MRKLNRIFGVGISLLVILSIFTSITALNPIKSNNNSLFTNNLPLETKDAGLFFITSNWASQDISLDGNITTMGEWSGATILQIPSPINAKIYFQNNATHLALLCDAIGDRSENISSQESNLNNLDHFDIGFDINYDQVRSNASEDAFTLLANGTLIRWQYRIASQSYEITPLSGANGAASFGASYETPLAHEIYELLIPLNLLSTGLGGFIGIGSEFNLTISNQGWPYDRNTAQINSYPEGIQYTNLNTWGKLKIAEKPSGSSFTGEGNNGNALLLFTNSSATATTSTDALDFSIPVPTDQWGLSFTNLTFSNLYAPNISKYIQRTVGISSSALFPYKHMGFNITNYCTLQNFSVYIYADTVSGSVSYNVLGAKWNTVYKRPEPDTANIISTGSLTIPLALVGTPYWHNVTNVNAVLNISNTQNSTFFISMQYNTATDSSWYYQTDATDGDQGPAWSGWPASGAPLTRDFGLKVDLIPISNNPTPTQVQMRVNGSAVANNGNWKSYSRYTSATGKVLFNVSAAWTLTYDVGYNCNYNKTVITQSNYNIIAREFPIWITNWSAQFPTNAKNYQMNVSIPIDWTVNNIKNGTYPTLGLYSSAHWKVVTIGGHKVVMIKNITNVATQDWLINCTGENYVSAIVIYRKVGMSYSEVNISKNILITEILHINSTITSPIVGGITDLIHGANLTTYLPGVRTCYTEDNIKPQLGWVVFTDWIIADATNEAGTYKLQVMWTNGTEVGLNELPLKIIYPTSTAVFVDQAEKVAPFSVDWFIGTENLINITAFYNNTFADKLGAISTTDASYRIINGSTLWINWNSLDQEKIGKGYYNKTLDVTNWLNGTYYIGIKLNKTGYQVQEFNVTLQLGYNTSIELKSPVSNQIQSTYPDNLTIQVNYTKFTGDMLLSANVYCTVNGGSPLSLFVKDNLFSIQINSTDYGVGNYNIDIFASKMGYYPRQLYINWTVQICPTDATYTVNGSVSQFEFYIGEKMLITSYFNDTNHIQPISSAITTLAWLNGAPQSPSNQGLGYYSWIVDSSPQAGRWNFTLELQKSNYQSQTLQFDIYVRFNTTLEWFALPPAPIQPLTTLGMAVNLSHFTVSKIQVPVAGQTIIFSIITNLGTNNYSKVTSSTGIAISTDYTVPIGVTSLSVQVIYAGNLTEFPTSLSASMIVMYPARADVFVDTVNTTGSLVVYKFIGLQSRVNFTVFYYNSTLSTKVGIPAATAQYQIINKTGGLWVTWTNLNALGGGYYNITLDVSSWQNDTYYIGIQLNKTLFQTQQFNITMNLVFSTNLALLQPSFGTPKMPYPDNLTIQVNYTKLTGDEILTAYVRVSINGTMIVPLELTGGLYRVQLNSTDFGVGTYNLSIMASLLGYYPQTINIIWIVEVCPTNYQVYVNWSHSPNQFYYGEQMHITIRYYDINHSVGLQYALVNITLPSGLNQTLGYISNGNYSIILDSSSQLGLWDLTIIVRKANYQNYTFNLQLYARLNTSIQWNAALPTQASAGQTLSLVVRMTYNNNISVPNRQITFVITTNSGQENHSVSTNEFGIASFNYVILQGVQTIHVVAVFDGSITEFSSNVATGTLIRVIYGGFWENYWWTILIGAVLLIVAMAGVRSRRKSKAIKEVKKKEIMSSFQDVTKILHLVVIHKGSGGDIFDYKVQERLDPTLLAGFIQAVKEFGREIDKGEK